jgi:hypothetical protein
VPSLAIPEAAPPVSELFEIPGAIFVACVVEKGDSSAGGVSIQRCRADGKVRKFLQSMKEDGERQELIFILLLKD